MLEPGATADSVGNLRCSTSKDRVMYECSLFSDEPVIGYRKYGHTRAHKKTDGGESNQNVAL